MDKKRRSIPKKERLAIAEKTNGKCGYCGIDLPKRWHVDHIEPFIKTSSTCDMDNLVAACPPCNLFKSSFTIEGFRRELGYQVGNARKYSVNFRMAEKFNQLKVDEKPIVFYFEKLSKA